MAVSMVAATIFFINGEANIVLAGGVLVVATLMMGCGLVTNFDRKKTLCKDGSVAQITKNEDGSLTCCCPECGDSWTFKPQTWAKWIFEDRRPPIKTRQKTEIEQNEQ